MNEFIAVAKSLEIKELCNADTETIDDDEPSPSNSVTSTDNSTEETIMSSSHMMNLAGTKE